MEWFASMRINLNSYMILAPESDTSGLRHYSTKALIFPMPRCTARLASNKGQGITMAGGLAASGCYMLWTQSGGASNGEPRFDWRSGATKGNNPNTRGSRAPILRNLQGYFRVAQTSCSVKVPPNLSKMASLHFSVVCSTAPG